MSICHSFRRSIAVLFLLVVLPCLAQQAHQTSASIKQSKTADAAACKGRMNCYNSEMRKVAAINNANRRAKAQVQAKSKNPNATATQSEVKQ